MLSDIQIKNKIQILTNKLNSRRFAEVIEETTLLLKKNKHQVFFNMLCIAYQNTGKLDLAESIMNEALKLNPNNPYFLNNMGITQHKKEAYNIAEKYFLKALRIVPNYINVLNNFANLKRDLDQNDLAIEYYKKSIDINPNVVETLLNISICYQSLGNYIEAKKNLRKLLEINPKFTTADRLLSSMIKYKDKQEGHFIEMMTKLNKLKLDEYQSANLFFALGKANEDLMSYEDSFNFYKKGNDILKKKSLFQIKKEKENFKKIKNFFTKKFNKLNSEKDRKFIFIVGMPRSGTSLVEQILSSHKDVYGAGELIFLDKIINNKFFKNDEVNNNKNLFPEIFENYIEKISFIDNTQKAFIDKTPLNFKFIGFIKYAFPNSKIINCKRDKVDVCWSNFKNFFPNSLPFSTSLEYLNEYFSLYEDLIEFWKIKFPGEVYDINYDYLIDDTDSEVKKLLDFCKLSWDQNCMNHHKNKKSIKTASATQARLPIYKSGKNASKPFYQYLRKLTN